MTRVEGSTSSSLGDSAAVPLPAERSSRPAITSTRDAITYAELHEVIAAIRTALDGELASGELVAIAMPPLALAVACLLACRAGGHPAVLLPVGLDRAELTDILKASGARLVLLPPGTHSTVPWPSTGTPVEGLRVARPGGSARAHHGLLRGAVIQLTSGSTGASRLAARPWGAIELELGAVRTALDLTHTDTVACASSIAHSYGLMGGTLAPLTAGGHVLLGDIDVAVERSAQVLFALPPAYASLLTKGRASALRPRFALSAGSPLPAGLYAAFLARTGLPIRQDYGTTEAGTISIDADTPASPETVGRPLAHMEVRIGLPREEILDPGEEGEIQVRSAAVAAGYLTPSGMAPATEYGWYHTSDAGSIDDTGRLRVGRRLRVPVEIAHIRVRPELIERALVGMPGVREVSVFPVARQAEPVLKAVVATDLSAAEIRRWCARFLLPPERPAVIEIVESLPRSPAGKVLQKYML